MCEQDRPSGCMEHVRQRRTMNVLRHHRRWWMGSPGVTPGIETQKEQCGGHLTAEVPERRNLYRMNPLVSEPRRNDD